MAILIQKIAGMEDDVATLMGVELNERNNEALTGAALRGDIATIQAWLNAGGDVNADVFYLPDFHKRRFPTRLLNFAASNARGELVRVLIANGADINFIESRHGGLSALLLAVAVPYRDPTETAKVLIEAGAELFNQDLSEEGNPYGDGERCTRLLFDAKRHPDIIRALLRAGIRVDGRDRDGDDVEASLQEDLALYMEFDDSGQTILSLQESARILEGARLAGSYKRYFLAPHHGVLALRTLVLRGRAEASPSTPLVARLFAGTTTEVAPDGAAAPSLLPDPLFFLVLEFWLGAY